MGDNGVTLLAQSKGFKQQVEQGPHQAMTACYQFINSDIHFDQMGILVLLRVLENNSCEGREQWWNGVRACRRRRQISWDSSIPVLQSSQPART